MNNVNSQGLIDFSDLELLDQQEGAADKARNLNVSHPGVVAGVVAAKPYIENCPDCRGTGVWRSYSGMSSGKCFKCKGVGTLRFAQPKEVRDANNARAKELAEMKRRDRALAFEKLHPAEYLWMMRKKDKFIFAQQMADAVYKFGQLTENQLAAVRRCMERDQQFEAQREAEKAQRLVTAPDLEVSKVQTALLTAKSNGLRNPKLRLAEFVFSLAGDNSVNAGAVYVKHKEEDLYLGKILDGKLLLVAAGRPYQLSILQAASNPAEAAHAYGQMTGNCSCCGRLLTAAESVARSIGPICAEKFGW